MQDYIGASDPPNTPDYSRTKEAKKSTKTNTAGIETGFLCEIGCGDGARVICLLARVIQQFRFWTQKIHADVDYCCYVWRRVECTSLGAGLKYSSLRLLTTAVWPRKYVPRCLTRYFF